jgi:hypothetical protein
MSNLDKWRKKLAGVSNYEAFRIIWDPKRPLTGPQRQALSKLHKEINDDKYKQKEQQKLDYWGNPESWVPDKADTYGRNNADVHSDKKN